MNMNIDVDVSCAQWRKARRSQGGGNACVELAAVSGVVAVRDSKNPDGGHLAFGQQALGAFFAQVKDDKLDL